MAATGHAGTHAPQSMHSSGWMYSIVACANSGSSLRGWMQSTGQTSTQAASLVSIHGSVMMKGMLANLRFLERVQVAGPEKAANEGQSRKIIPCPYSNAKNSIGLTPAPYPGDS